MATPTTDSRPPFPPFSLETAIQKVQAAEDAGTPATRSTWLRLAPSTRNGGTVRSTSLAAARSWSS